MFQVKMLQPALPKLPVADVVFKRCWFPQTISSKQLQFDMYTVCGSTNLITLMKQVTS